MGKANELPTSLEPDKPRIKELLTQLQAAIASDPNLLQIRASKSLSRSRKKSQSF